jgi:hypothetical protein
LLLAAALTVAGCSSGTTIPSAATLLNNARDTFNKTQSFHFVLTATHLGPNDALPITSATGDVARPDRLRATANTSVSGFALTVKLIVVGQQAWLDPGFGSYQPNNQYASFLTIFDPTQGVGAALAQMQQPSTPQDSNANGTACWKISGKIDTTAVSAVVNGNVVSGQTVPATVCIGKTDNQLDSVTLTGAITTTDTAQTVRTFVLSQFNQPVTIQAPAS